MYSCPELICTYFLHSERDSGKFSSTMPGKILQCLVLQTRHSTYSSRIKIIPLILYDAPLVRDQVAPSRVRFLVFTKTSDSDNMQARPSAIGPANSAPSNPNTSGNKSSAGIKKTPCRDKERIMPCLTFPMPVK